MPKDFDQFDTFEQALPEIIVGKTYRIKGLLGKGGMGNVYLAEHLIIGKQYALKMLAPEQITQDNWNRFHSEGKAIALLDHPHIVKIHNMGVDETGYPYYVMDLIKGQSLLDKLRQNKPLSLADLLTVFTQIASALDYSHKKGIIHRDIKPSNIMVLDNATGAIDTRLVDFGIAKLLQFSGADRQRLTATGEIFGTPYYMSPEQCIGARLDQRSDIYSFGCTLFEALCGKPPFKGSSATETVMMHLNQAPPTLAEASGIDYGQDLEALLAKLLQKDRDNRYDSMQQVLHDLERIQVNKPVAQHAKSLGFERKITKAPSDKDSRTKSISNNLPTIAIGLAALVIVLISIPVTKVLLHKDKKATAQEVSRPVVETQKDTYVREPSKQEKEVIQDFLQSNKSITAEIKPDGQKFIHFPAVNLGDIYQALNQNADAISYAQKTDISADGTKEVPANVALVLRSHSEEAPALWLYPSLLTKFSQNVMQGIWLEGYANRDSDIDNTDKIIDALDKWTSLTYMGVDDCSLSKHALDRLDKHPELIVLKINCKDFDASLLARHKLINRLLTLKLNQAKNIKPLLKTLSGPNRLTHLYLQDVDLDAHAFDQISKCETLRYLELANCKICIEQIQAIKRVEKFDTLRIHHCSGLTPEIRKTLEDMEAKMKIDLKEKFEI
ncbi:MAG: Protein kinase [Cyanobacteriota bacterium erpe_2018_sw_39hr_WHONDRS-SW48-000098_B_bin.30]|nr:Protein kinase [Cyanobacteriota bacterium erpe_2018_sw_39hr_WHONDRS-SW48-000098_B_bin.30]